MDAPALQLSSLNILNKVTQKAKVTHDFSNFHALRNVFINLSITRASRPCPAAVLILLVILLFYATSNKYLQPLIPPTRFDIFSLLTRGCSEGLGAF